MPNKPAKRPRGRPEHQVTAATRRQVSIAAGGGMRHEDIAIALGISRETLRKHYITELTVVASLRRLEVLQSLHIAAKKGSTSAAKAYLANEPQLEAPPAGVGDGAAAPAVPEKQVKMATPLGKKEQANADAKTAHVGTEWD
jgi:hypothetical protein